MRVNRFIKSTSAALLSIVLSASLASVCQADVVKLGVGEQGASNSSVERPHRGMTKDEVASRFGQPQSRHAPVGDPPISSWDYDSFTVYFEYDHVLHSVLHRNKNN